VGVGGIEEPADPVDELGRHFVAPAFRAKHLLQLALEVGMAPARIATAEVPLDLDALEPHELPVEVELDLSKDVLALSR
jgi:hypothetical protein